MRCLSNLHSKRLVAPRGYSCLIMPLKLIEKTKLALVVLAIALIVGSGAHAQYPGLGDPGVTAGPGVAGVGLVPVETQVDGGTIPIGATAQVVVRFRNEGGQPVQTGVIQL